MPPWWTFAVNSKGAEAVPTLSIRRTMPSSSRRFRPSRRCSCCAGQKVRSRTSARPRTCGDECCDCSAAPEERTKRLNLRDRVQTLEYSPVASDFEAQFCLYRTLREVFPSNYADRLKLRFAPLLRLILENDYPRVAVTTRIQSLKAKSAYYGPFRFAGGGGKVRQRCSRFLPAAPLHRRSSSRSCLSRAAFIPR